MNQPQDNRPLNRRGESTATTRMLFPVDTSFWAFSAGYLGLFSLLCLPAPLALVAGIIGVWDIKTSMERKGWQAHGMGRAIFGIVTGAVGTVIMGLAAYSVISGG